MQSSGAGRTHPNATADDCARLWLTLTGEYIPGLRIELKIVTLADAATGIRMDLVDDCLGVADGKKMVHVWATRLFFNQLNLISSGALFDLLISGFRKIDDFFRYGESYAPDVREA